LCSCCRFVFAQQACILNGLIAQISTRSPTSLRRTDTRQPIKCCAIHRYTEGSKLPSEFDITDFVSPGSDAEVAMRVLRFSSGSWLEDQVTNHVHTSTRRLAPLSFSLALLFSHQAVFGRPGDQPRPHQHVSTPARLLSSSLAISFTHQVVVGNLNTHPHTQGFLLILSHHSSFIRRYRRILRSLSKRPTYFLSHSTHRRTCGV
jgi:hypothetical protein